MNRHLLAALFGACLCTTAMGQYPLEASYASAAIGPGQYNRFFLHEFEDLGFRYVHLIRDTTVVTVKMYDLSHNLVQTIDLSAALDINPTNPVSKSAILFSQYLFDTDPGIELLFVSSTMPTSATAIVDESGTVLHQFIDEGPMVEFSAQMQQMHVVVNTPSGTKLLLNNMSTGMVNVYALPGTLPTCCSNQAMQIQDGSGGPKVEVFPVPSSDNVSFSFGTTWVDGRLEVFNATGELVLGVPVNGTSALLSLSGFATGTYLYRITSGGGHFAAGPLVRE